MTTATEAPAVTAAAAPPAPAAPAPPTVAAAPAPTDYSKLVAPEGFTPDHVKAITAFATERKWSPEQAQAALDRDAANQASFSQMSKAWDGELRKELGQKYDETVKHRDSFINSLATTDQLKADVADFIKSGWATNPVFTRLFAAAGEKLAEKPLVAGATAATAKHTTAADLFPETYKQMTPAQRKAAGFE